MGLALSLLLAAAAAQAAQAPLWDRVASQDVQRAQFRAYLPPKLRARLDQPVTARAYVDFLVGRGNAFRVNGQPFPVQIDRDSIIDAGSTQQTRTTLIALIDVAASPAIGTLLRRSFRVNPARNAVTASFITTSSFDAKRSRDERLPLHRIRHKVNVTVASTDGRRVRQWESDGGRWRLIFDVAQGKDQTLTPQQAAQRLRIQGQLYTGEYQRLAVQGAAPTAAVVQELSPRRISRVCRGGRCGADPSLPRRIANRSLALAPTTPTRLNPALEASAVDTAAQVQARAFPPAPPPATAQSVLLWGNPASPVNLSCNNFCSVGDCSGCCENEAADRALAISTATLGCSALAGACVPCQIGCALYSVHVQTVSAATWLACTGGCLIPHEANISAAPEACGTVASAGQLQELETNLPAGAACLGPQQCASSNCDARVMRCVPQTSQGRLGDYCVDQTHCRPKYRCRPSAPTPGADFQCQAP